MAYGKIWNTMFTGSMVGAGPTAFAVMTYAVACANMRDRIDLNPKLLATVIGTDEDDIKKAISYLCSEDSESRTKNTENGKTGVRLVREDQYQYHIPNRGKYCMMQSERDAQKVSRRSSRKYRAKKITEQFDSMEWDEADWEKQDRAKYPDDWDLGRK